MLALIDFGYFPNLYKLHRSPYLYLKTENRKRKTFSFILHRKFSYQHELCAEYSAIIG